MTAKMWRKTSLTLHNFSQFWVTFLHGKLDNSIKEDYFLFLGHFLIDFVRAQKILEKNELLGKRGKH